LFEVFVEAGHCVELDLGGQIAERFPLGERMGGGIALGAGSPDRHVVPGGTFAIGEELGGGGGMI
jgi:hypothetical protein